MSTVLVTGANRGLGLSLVSALLARPAASYPLILGTHRQPLDADAPLAALTRESGGRFKALQIGDIADESDCGHLAQQVGEATHGKGVNILINNAGYALQPALHLSTLQGALNLRRTLLTNAFGPLLLSTTLRHHRLLLPHPSLPSPTSSSSLTSPSPETPEVRRPPIIANITSSQASLSSASLLFSSPSSSSSSPFPPTVSPHVAQPLPQDHARDDIYFHPIYAVSKATLNAMSLHLARELHHRPEQSGLGGRGAKSKEEEVIVGCIHPGWIKTTMGRKYANLYPDESAYKVLDVIEGWKTIEDSGKYVDWEGKPLPW